MKHIAEVLTMIKETDSRFIKEVKQKIYYDYYDDERIQQLLDKAAFLDLKFKKCVSHYDDTVEKRLWIILVLRRKNQTEKHSCKQKNEGFGSCI